MKATSAWASRSRPGMWLVASRHQASVASWPWTRMLNGHCDHKASVNLRSPGRGSTGASRFVATAPGSHRPNRAIVIAACWASSSRLPAPLQDGAPSRPRSRPRRQAKFPGSRAQGARGTIGPASENSAALSRPAPEAAAAEPSERPTQPDRFERPPYLRPVHRLALLFSSQTCDPSPAQRFLHGKSSACAEPVGDRAPSTQM